jgi:hypothetical protein
MEPITEQRPMPGLIVYGYLRMTAPSPARRTALTRALTGYCEQHELVLAAIFTDRGPGQRAPGFTGLLDAISASASYGIVVPTRAHLGSGSAAAQRLAAITEIGRRLMIVHDAPACAAAGATQ